MSKGEIVAFTVADFIVCYLLAWAGTGSVLVGIVGAILCAGIPCGVVIASEWGL